MNSLPPRPQPCSYGSPEGPEGHVSAWLMPVRSAVLLALGWHGRVRRPPQDPRCWQGSGLARRCCIGRWQLIAGAKRIVGFDGWQRQTLFSRCVTQAERIIGARGQAPAREGKPGWGVTDIARVRVTVLTRSGGLLIREGTGAGHGIDADLGLAHESAIKEAETDAMKRALVTFGNPFGLAHYDKGQRQVSGAAPALVAAPAGRGEGSGPWGGAPTGNRPAGAGAEGRRAPAGGGPTSVSCLR